MPRTYFPGRGTLIEQTFLEGKAEGWAKGRKEERAQAIQRVLDHRGILTTPEQRRTIADCPDLERLGRWLDRALTVSTVEDLFCDAD
ncbi:hypothetical protein [Streptomyces sp. SAJ15]|uniref:hypothetical protein n=1 Tax=Streptomyces sp. SAJ15 TaxID=2011095 RepID=UPI0011857A5F|nr:hypothetical protein [Streptomyces sp. SAJ15]TVL94209.1 hypothetical protein CD790_04255 [Streptomyces sp. SAJ15]